MSPSLASQTHRTEHTRCDIQGRMAWIARAALVAKMRAAGVKELSVSGAKVRDFVGMLPDQKGQLLEMAGSTACRKSRAKSMTTLLEESGFFFGVAPCKRKNRR